MVFSGGAEEVRTGLEHLFEDIPDVLMGRISMAAHRHKSIRQQIDVRGADSIAFAGRMIIRKDSFWQVLA
ncbi:MAG: hypothetical protein GX112_03560 [Clostridiaceae bacterium]|jgi:hypothetical protein|nr:hypothetical protein [Clostridiaceae bacterium]